MHLNKAILIGRVGERGPRLTYDERSTPTCGFTLEVDEVSQSGKVFTLYVAVEVTGKFAEAAAEHLEPGQQVLVDGKLKYKKFTDKASQLTSKLIVSTWQVTPAPVTVAPSA